MSFKNNFFLVIVCLLLASKVVAQVSNNSPYSQYGIGDLQPGAFIPQAGMSGLGVSNANGVYINNVNPALIARNRNTVLDLGISGQYKKITSSQLSQTNSNANLAYVALVFPIYPSITDTSSKIKWTSGIGLKPYSVVQYNNKVTSGVSGTTTSQIVNLEGSGGLNRFDFNNGFQIGKDFYAGVKISYIFGGITEEVSTQSNIVEGSSGGQNLFYKVVKTNRTNHGDFAYKLGFAYRKKFIKSSYFNVGLTYDPSVQLSAKRLTTFETRSSVTNLPISNNLIDTLAYNKKGLVRLPAQYQIGISFDDPFHWQFGVDFTYYTGKDYRDFDNKPAYDQNGYSITVGGEWTPNLNSISSYFDRVAYKAGFNYTVLPIITNKKELTDMSFSLGGTFPIGRNVTFLNLAFSAGQRGTTSSELIKEQYFKASMGVTLNDRWFQRRKIN